MFYNTCNETGAAQDIPAMQQTQHTDRQTDSYTNKKIRVIHDVTAKCSLLLYGMVTWCTSLLFLYFRRVVPGAATATTEGVRCRPFQRGGDDGEGDESVPRHTHTRPRAAIFPPPLQ